MQNENKNVKKTFLSGVFWLSVSTILVKVIGLFYKIPMLSYLGAEGMGYFNSAYEIYAFFCVIATAGLPVALSVLISAALAQKNPGRVKRLYRSAMIAFVCIGFLGSIFMAAGAGLFCRMMQSEYARLSILAISPTVFVICVSSALRGYFQGYGSMVQTAVSQLIEALGKLGFGLLFARAALHAGKSIPYVAAAAGAGLTLGTVLSLFYLIVEKMRFRKSEAGKAETLAERQPASSKEKISVSLAKMAIPITLGAVSVNLTKLIDMTMILRRLQSIGYNEVLANQAYGGYTTLALSVYGLLPTLVNAIALPLIPLLSAAIASGDRTRQHTLVQASYRLTALFAMPASVAMILFAKPLLSLLFARQAATVAAAAPLLSMLGVSVFLSCMISATNSVLHAYQSVNRPIVSLLAGSTVKIIVAYFLIGNPQIGILGAPISTFICNAIVVLLNLIFADRLCKLSSLWDVCLKPLAFSGLAGGIAFWLYRFAIQRIGEGIAATLSAVATMGLLYLAFSIFGGGLSNEDLATLPVGRKMIPVLSKVRSLYKRKEIKRS